MGEQYDLSNALWTAPAGVFVSGADHAGHNLETKFNELEKQETRRRVTNGGPSRPQAPIEKGNAMKTMTLIASAALAGLLSTGAFAASTTTAKTTTPPAAATTTVKKAVPTKSPEKTAISKQCSTLADAKGLHGKDREKFRSECKKNGGKAPQ